jgi:hypothetical protein
MNSHLTLRTLRVAVIAAGTVVVSLLAGSRAHAQDYCGPYSRPDLFYNYYVPPVASSCYPGTIGAELYPCPRPTPPLVGQTYITYQPLDPHEFLYRHHRTYYRDNGPYAGVTKTYVCWW